MQATEALLRSYGHQQKFVTLESPSAMFIIKVSQVQKQSYADHVRNQRSQL